jgi:hypothetical protein
MGDRAYIGNTKGHRSCCRLALAHLAKVHGVKMQYDKRRAPTHEETAMAHKEMHSGISYL